MRSLAADEGQGTDTRFAKARFVAQESRTVTGRRGLLCSSCLCWLCRANTEHRARQGLLLMAQVKLRGRVAGPHPGGEVSPDLPALLGSRNQSPGGWGIRGAWEAQGETEIKSLADTSWSLQTEWARQVQGPGSRLWVQGRRVGTEPGRDALNHPCVWTLGTSPQVSLPPGPAVGQNPL